MSESGRSGKARFTAGIVRFIPFIAYHHVVMIFLACVIVLLSITTAGCSTSNNMFNVYILSISYLPSNTTLPSMTSNIESNPDISTTFATIATNHSKLEVRVSYFGLCISQTQSEWICLKDASALSNLLETYNGGNLQELDPLNLIWIAGRFKDKMLFSGILLTCIPLAFLAILLLSTFPGWQHDGVDGNGSEIEVKPFPRRAVSQITSVVLAIGSLFSFIAILTQHIASATGSTMVEALSYGTVKSKTGAISMVLGWIGVVLFVICLVAMVVMILTISMLEAIFTSDSGSDVDSNAESALLADPENHE